MRFTLNRSETSINAINRGGIRILPDANGVFDTELYRDSISVDTGSLAITDMRYTSVITPEQVASAKKEVEELVTYWESQGIAKILDKPNAKSEKKAQ